MLDENSASIIRTFAVLIKSFNLQIYYEDTGTGLIRHLQIRVGRKTGQIMVIIVTASPVFPSKKNLANALVTAHPEIMDEIEEKVRAHYGIGAEGQEAEEPAQAAPADAEEVMDEEE